MKKLAYCLGSAAAAVIILSALFNAGVFSYINVKLSDGIYGGGKPLQDIAIVGIDDKSLQQIGRWPWDRQVFADALEKLGGNKVIAIDVGFFEASGNDATLAEAVNLSGNVVLGAEYTGFESKAGKTYGTGLLAPVESLRDSAAGIGYVNIPLDLDGVNRRANIGIEGQYQSFAEEIYMQIFGRKFAFDMDVMGINFAGMPGTFRTYSFADVLSGYEKIEGKIVLIGAVSPDFHDEYIVPTSEGSAMPGVEVHANILQTMITRKFIKEQSSFSVAMLMLVLSAAAALLLFMLPLRSSTIILSAAIVFYPLAAILAFSWAGISLNLIYPQSSILMTYVFSVILFYSTEKQEKKKAIQAFSKHVSADLVNEIMKNPDMLKLGGQKKEMTIMFSDIRKFTSISEKLAPEQLVHLLNDYLTEMSDIIMENKGVVDKFIGDAIMALWGVPVPEKKHAALACKTALEMRRKLADVQKKWEKQGIPSFEIGIGINTGDAVAGNVGSYKRFNYTAIGDSVNLSSRVEGLTKEYGVGILITENTYRHVKDSFTARKIDLVAVKGKNEPVWVYELVDGKKEKYMEHYEKGISHYLKREWDAAVSEFERALKLKDDAASALFVQRCRDFKKTPPPYEWGGVFEMKRK